MVLFRQQVAALISYLLYWGVYLTRDLYESYCYFYLCLNGYLGILHYMDAILNSKYTIPLCLILGGSVILLFLNLILKSRIKKLEEKVKEGKYSIPLTFYRFIQRIAVPLLFLGLLSIAIAMISFDPQIQKIVKIIFAIIMTFIIVRSLNKTLELAFSRYFEKEWANHDREKNIRPLLSLIKFLFWIVGIIILLANLGLDVSTAITGLGVGGIAVAIAAQGILGDLFSYFVIFFDKPFELGDFIVFGDKMGVVESIGIKSIRIRVLTGELLIIANHDLTDSRIHNFKQMQKRRVVFSIGVIYETPPEKLEKIPTIIKDIIASVETIPGIICDRCHFNGFGNFSLNFETVYFVPTNDYITYMNVQQEIYFKLFRAFAKEDISFAYPTQLVYTKDDSDASEESDNQSTK